MPKRKPRTRKADANPDVDLLAKPELKELADFTKKLLKVPKSSVDKQKPRSA